MGLIKIIYHTTVYEGTKAFVWSHIANIKYNKNNKNMIYIEWSLQ